MPKLSIVVPVYYNEDNLRPLYADLKEKLLDRDNPFEVEIVMVDDGSGDRSYQVMEELKAQDDRIHLYHLSRNFGSDAAVPVRPDSEHGRLRRGQVRRSAGTNGNDL